MVKEMSNNESCRIAKEIIDIIRTNEDKKIK